MDILKQLHTSVAQAVEVSLDDAYSQLNAELALRDSSLQAAQDNAAAADEARLNDAARIRQLEHEILCLREELSQRQMDSKESEASATKSRIMREAYAPECILESSNNDGVGDPQAELLRIQKIVETKYRALYGEVQTLIKVSGELRTQIKRHKHKLVRFQDCMNRDEFTLVLDGATVKFRKVQPANGEETGLPRSKSRSSFTPLLGMVGNRSTDAPTPSRGLPKSSSETNLERVKNSARNEGPDVLSELPSTQSGPSESSQIDSNDPLPGTRVPKRKRASLLQSQSTRSSTHGLGNNNVERPALVKSETLSSSPLRSIPQCRDPPPGTQDLDEIGGTVETPTKRRTSNFVHSNQNFENQRSPTVGPTPTVDNLWTANPPSRRSNGENRKLERVVRHALPSVAEDGDDGYCETGSRKRQQGLSRNNHAGQLGRTNTPAEGRLQDLLESPMAARSPLDMPRRFPNAGRHSLQDLDTLIDNGTSPSGPIVRARRSMGNLNTRRNSANRNGPRPDKSEGGLPVETPEDEPYRARPLHRLELSHFKINPDYNQGLDYAFDDVMRKKDERRCAPGCMRADCCGEKFLAMAHIGGLPTELRKSFPGNNPRSEEHSPGISNADGARAIANTYGKHRHHHQRPRSPPGFWRADMPSTQDVERDREDARKYEREKVKERYREAMRPGGLWKYADE